MSFTVSQSGALSTLLSPLEDPASPYYLHHSENHSSVIVTPVLTSINFASWKRSFLLVVSIGLSTILCVVFKEQIQLRWWGLLLACVIAAGFTLPVGVITATTNQVDIYSINFGVS